MRAFHLSCECDFKGANLCTNSGVYLSREKAIDVLAEGFPFDCFGNCETVADLEERQMFSIEEIDLE